MRLGEISGPIEWLILGVLGMLFVMFAAMFLGRAWTLRRKAPIQALISVLLGALVIVFGFISTVVLYD